MKKGIIGIKIGMTQLFLDDGTCIPVTVVKAGPCVVTQRKTAASDGYNAVQVGFEPVAASSATKPALGHCTKSGKGVFRHLKELRLEGNIELNLGDTLTVDQ